MKFDLVLLSSHGTSRGYLAHEIKSRLKISTCEACLDMHGTLDYRWYIEERMKLFVPAQNNALAIDNTCGSRYAPLAYYRKFFAEESLFINIVRDPIKKFCTIINYFSRVHLKDKNRTWFSKDTTENILSLFNKRYWDAMMALPYARFRNEGKYIFLDATDITPPHIETTMKRIAAHLGIKEISCCDLLSPGDVKDRFFTTYHFEVIYKDKNISMKFSKHETTDIFCIYIDNSPVCDLFCLDHVYVCSNDIAQSEADTSLNQIIAEEIVRQYGDIAFFYCRYMQSLVTPEQLVTFIYSDPDFYDLYKSSVYTDAEYIMKNYKKCEQYWDALKLLDMSFPSPQKNEYCYKIKNWALNTLYDGWSDAVSYRIDKEDSDIVETHAYSITKNPRLLIPVPFAGLFVVTLCFEAKIAGTLSIHVDNHMLASAPLNKNYCVFPIPASMSKDKTTLIIELKIESAELSIMKFRLLSITLSRPMS